MKNDTSKFLVKPLSLPSNHFKNDWDKVTKMA